MEEDKVMAKVTQLTQPITDAEYVEPIARVPAGLHPVTREEVDATVRGAHREVTKETQEVKNEVVSVEYFYYNSEGNDIAYIFTVRQRGSVSSEFYA